MSYDFDIRREALHQATTLLRDYCISNGPKKGADEILLTAVRFQEFLANIGKPCDPVTTGEYAQVAGEGPTGVPPSYLNHNETHHCPHDFHEFWVTDTEAEYLALTLDEIRDDPDFYDPDLDLDYR